VPVSCDLLISRVRLSGNAVELGILASDHVSDDLAGHVDPLDGVEGSRAEGKGVSNIFMTKLNGRDPNLQILLNLIFVPIVVAVRFELELGALEQARLLRVCSAVHLFLALLNTLVIGILVATGNLLDRAVLVVAFHFKLVLLRKALLTVGSSLALDGEEHGAVGHAVEDPDVSVGLLRGDVGLVEVALSVVETLTLATQVADDARGELVEVVGGADKASCGRHVLLLDHADFLLCGVDVLIFLLLPAQTWTVAAGHLCRFEPAAKAAAGISVARVLALLLRWWLLLLHPLCGVSKQLVSASVCAHGLLAVASSQTTVASSTAPRARSSAVRVLAVSPALAVARLSISSSLWSSGCSAAVASGRHRTLVSGVLAGSRVTGRRTTGITAVQREVAE